VVVLEGSFVLVISDSEFAACLSDLCLIAVWARDSVDSRGGE
jgi:hypothetical protein